MLLFLASLLASQLVGQPATLDLYLRPDAAEAPLATVPANDQRLGDVLPVIEADLAAAGWRFADFTGEVAGYIPDSKIGKDLQPVEGALILAGPSSEAPVLGVFKDGDPLDIIDTGAWWEVRWTGTLTVFFVQSTPPPLPPVTVDVAAPLASGSAAVAMGSDATGNAATGSGSSIALPDRPMVAPKGLIQGFEGVFRQAKPTLGLFKPKAPFFLEGADGNRIAWIDTQELILSGTLKSYFDKPVILYGEMEAISSRDWIIRARTLREK